MLISHQPGRALRAIVKHFRRPIYPVICSVIQKRAVGNQYLFWWQLLELPKPCSRRPRALRCSSNPDCLRFELGLLRFGFGVRLPLGHQSGRITFVSIEILASGPVSCRGRRRPNLFGFSGGFIWSRPHPFFGVRGPSVFRCRHQRRRRRAHINFRRYSDDSLRAFGVVSASSRCFRSHAVSHAEPGGG